MSERLTNLILEVRDELMRLELDTDENNKIINTFLLRYCAHDVVTDTIDLTPDKSVIIKFCKRCGTTL